MVSPRSPSPRAARATPHRPRSPSAVEGLRRIPYTPALQLRHRLGERHGRRHQLHPSGHHHLHLREWIGGIVHPDRHLRGGLRHRRDRRVRLRRAGDHHLHPYGRRPRRAAFTPTPGPPSAWVASVTVTNGGWAYTTPPTVSFATTHGSGGTATAALGGITIGLTYNGSTWVWADGSIPVRTCPRAVDGWGATSYSRREHLRADQLLRHDRRDPVHHFADPRVRSPGDEPVEPVRPPGSTRHTSDDGGLAQSTPNPNQVVVRTPRSGCPTSTR